MSRISQILADSLSEAELGLLVKIYHTSSYNGCSNDKALTMLQSLRLVEFASASSLPRISELGNSVLYERNNDEEKFSLSAKSLH